MRTRTRFVMVAAVVLCCAPMVLGLRPAPAEITSIAAPSASAGFVPLFNGTDLDGWYSWIDGLGRDRDPEGYFTVEDDGSLNVLDLPATSETKPFGYLSTIREYSDFHLRLEYRWGETKFAPRATALRDSGLLYHMTGPDAIWGNGVEAQIQEGDTGDLILLGGTRAESEVLRGSSLYEPGGERVSTRFVQARTVADTPDGWNSVEIIVRGRSAVHIVNGVVVNRSFGLTAGGEALDTGRIMLQAEGAEVSYRNVEIKELASAPAILVYSRTTGFRHASIPVAVDAIRSLGRAEGFEVEATEDPAAFTDANLARFSAVVFVSTTGEVLTPARRPALEQYIRSGGGFAGIHAASDGGYDWPWYGELVGSYFRRHPAIQEANIQVETTRHPSTAHLGSTWTRTDEWYDFANNPRADVTVLLNLDEASYSGGQMGDHPISWYREFDGGRTWYTGGGHTSEAFGEPDFLAHLLGGIQYAGALTPRLPGPALDRSDWQVSASSGGASAHRAIDGDLTSRYASGVVQVPGMTFDIDLGRSRTFQAVVLDLLGEYNDEPRSWEVLVSDSPSFSAAPIAVGAGTSPRTTARFEPVTARYVRIRQVGQDSRRWWSIYELNLIGDANFVVEGGAGADAPAQRVSLGS